MKVDLNVDVGHLSRVEGHGDIHVKVAAGEVLEARWSVVETPRFFEPILRGKHWSSASVLTSRICGICSIGHALASVRATEDAFGVEIPALARELRLLAKHAETLQSHFLHIFFLAAPDFVGTPSVLPLLESKPEIVTLAARLRRLGNRLSDLVAGRTTHPVSIQVGGMTQAPDPTELRAFRGELHAALPDVATAVELLAGFQVPAFAPEAEWVSLKGEGDYPWIGGRLVSSDGVEKAERDYRAMTNEYPVADGTSKWCKLSREVFGVGALARVNNNHRFLRPEAQAAARRLGLEPVCHNPFLMTAAQLVEAVHVAHESLELIDRVLAAPAGTPTRAPVEPRAGVGVGAVEVPRGILYHAYEYDAAGRIVRADCVIPTTQNNAKIQKDLGGLARMLAADGATDEKAELVCSMLVRAYDPCISCSVH